ncbi:MAG: VOC family protein [Dongiaceae bacterium]
MTDPSPIKIYDIDHVVLRVRDMAAMRRFYCDVLGCGVQEELPDLDMVQLRAGRALIDLVDVAGTLGRQGGAAPGKEGRNMDHFCVRVEPFDADAILRHLRAHGVEPGEVVQRSGAEGTGPSIYLDDPEGNMVELKGPSTS